MSVLLLLALGLGASLLIFSGDDSESNDPEGPGEDADQDVIIQDQTSVTTGGGDDRIASVGTLDQVVNINSGGGDDIVSLDAAGHDQGVTTPVTNIDTGDGDDTVYATGYNDIVTGSGDDVVTINSVVGQQFEYSEVDTGDGDDVITTQVSDIMIDAGDGGDMINVSRLGYGAVDAGAGDDTLRFDFEDEFGFDTMETITAGDGDDLIEVRAETRLVASDDEFVIGGDRINGDYNPGLSGGAGADTFDIEVYLDNYRVESGETYVLGAPVFIEDFDPDEDVLILNPGLEDLWPDAEVTEVSNPGDGNRYEFTVTYGGGTSGATGIMTLMVISDETLTAGDLQIVRPAA